MNEMVFGSWRGDRNNGQADFAGTSTSTRQEKDGQEDFDDRDEEDVDQSTEISGASNMF
jgi:hypothetical protein